MSFPTSGDLRNVDIVIRGCPFSVDVSTSNVAEGCRDGVSATNSSRVVRDVDDGFSDCSKGFSFVVMIAVGISFTKSRDLSPLIDERAIWVEELKSPVSLLAFDGALKDRERRGGGPV